jgi:asparagine synthase (glutamine-hydrolysing)
LAGIYINFDPQNTTRLDDALKRLKVFDEEHFEKISTKNVAITWASHDDLSLFGPAYDPKTGVRALTFGRVSWDESDWKAAEKLDNFEGGLSCRLLLRDYLQRGVAAIERPSGPAVVVVYDPREEKLHVVTDHFGYQPVFLYKPHDFKGCVIATHPDVLADDFVIQVTPDKVSMAEYLSAWRITPPHTYYNEIKYAGAARLCTWDFTSNTFSTKEYWSPNFNSLETSFKKMVDQLEFAIKESIRIRTLPRLAPVSILISGGMDSRTMLFSCASKKTATGINMFVKPSRESSISKELCDISGVHYVGIPLRDDYYPKWSRLAAKICGGMNLIEDNHYLGIRDIVQQHGTKTILSACTTDWLFKGYGLDKTHMQFIGRNLPVYKFLDHRRPGFPPNAPGLVPEKYAAAIRQRYDNWYAGCPQQLHTETDRLLCEDKRVRPACYAVSISGPIMYRTYPYDTFFGDRLIADCYGKLKASWKLNGQAWGAATRRICTGAEHVVDANWGAPMGASIPHKIFVFGLGWFRRRIQKVINDAPPVQGISIESDSSWPNMGWYIIHSETIKTLWLSIPEHYRKLLFEILGYDPWNIPLNEWARRPGDFFRMLALLLHWSSSEDDNV